MAMMGGGGSHSHKAINNNRSGKQLPYGLMLLLAFGAALLGVMVLHKLRERRIFNLLVKEKDRDLFSLQFLLQKEKEYSKEMKRKNEVMKAKIYSLRTQKMELDRKTIEMQSTISSLKDEQKAMESALEERHNDMKMDSSSLTCQFTALQEILKQKEAQIEDLKHRLEVPVKVWSVSTDDPSNPPLNFTVNSNSKENGGELSYTSVFMDAENSTRVEESMGVTNSSGVAENSTQPIVDPSGNTSKSMDTDSHEKDGNEHTELENSREYQKQQVKANSKGRMKLETSNSKIDTGSRLRGKHGHLSRTNGNRWRILSKHRDSQNMNTTRFYRVDQHELRSTRESHASNEGIEKTSENQHQLNSTVSKLLKSQNINDDLQNRDVNVDPNQQVEREIEDLKKSHDSLNRQVLRNISVNGEDEPTDITTSAEKQNLDQVRQQEPETEAKDGEIEMPQDAEAKDGPKEMLQDVEAEDKQDAETEATNMEAADKQEPELEATNIEAMDKQELETQATHIEAADKQEPDMEAADEQPETEANNGDSLRESASSLEEDKQEYKEETDESEF